MSQPARTLTVKGVSVPPLLYGTAWKEDATQALVTRALEAGFRGIDTANQRKHYDEEGVGRALSAWLDQGLGERGQLFVQTKFTFAAGQDERLPYDPRAPIAMQVEQSFRSSLGHLGLETIDSYVLHGPSQRAGWNATDREAWQAMEALHDGKKTKLLGVSNVTLSQLQALCDGARVRPAFVQNRCYASMGWDFAVRSFCLEHDIVYQGFSLLTANRQVWEGQKVRAVAKRHGKTPAQVIFRYAMDLKILPLTGTTNPLHLREDLGVLDFALDAADHASLEDTAFA